MEPALCNARLPISLWTTRNAWNHFSCTVVTVNYMRSRTYLYKFQTTDELLQSFQNIHEAGMGTWNKQEMEHMASEVPQPILSCSDRLQNKNPQNVDWKDNLGAPVNICGFDAYLYNPIDIWHQPMALALPWILSPLRLCPLSRSLLTLSICLKRTSKR